MKRQLNTDQKPDVNSKEIKSSLLKVVNRHFTKIITMTESTGFISENVSGCSFPSDIKILKNLRKSFFFLM